MQNNNVNTVNIMVQKVPKKDGSCVPRVWLHSTSTRDRCCPDFWEPIGKSSSWLVGEGFFELPGKDVILL